MLEMKAVIDQLKENLLDLKFRSTRVNLVFTNIPQLPDENTETVLTDCVLTKLNINGVKLGRAHRLRSRQEGRDRSKPLPIVAKFSVFKDRERVRKSSPRFAGTDYSIQEQFPDEIEQRRKPIYPLIRQAMREK